MSEYEFEIPENPFEAFYFGLECVLDEWEVLNVAVKNHWTDKAEEKKENLFYEILELFERKGAKVETHYLGELLQAIMLEDFGVDVQDGSIGHVASNLFVLYRDVCVKKEFGGWLKMMSRRQARLDSVEEQVARDLANSMVVVQSQIQGEDDDEEDDDEEVEEVLVKDRRGEEREEMNVDPEGWTTVVGKNKRK
jgi:pre-rRNA-processing protein TSR2